MRMSGWGEVRSCYWGVMPRRGLMLRRSRERGRLMLRRSREQGGFGDRGANGSRLRVYKRLTH